MQTNFLNDNHLMERAPAIFADAPIRGVSDRYAFVPTITAVNLLRDAGWYPTEASQASVRAADHEGFQKHLVRFGRSDMVLNGERVEVVLYNSHNRGCAFLLYLGVFRMVCSNGMIVGEKFAGFRHKHVGFDPGAFFEGAREVGSHGARVADRIEDFRAIGMSPIEQGVFSEAATALVYDDVEKAPYQPAELNRPRRSFDRGNDLWSTYNRVQENLIKGGIRGWTRGSNGRPRRTTTRRVKSIDKDRRLNQGLWTIAEYFADLRAGKVDLPEA